MNKNKVFLSVMTWTVVVILIAQGKKRRISKVPKGAADQEDQNRTVTIFR